MGEEGRKGEGGVLVSSKLMLPQKNATEQLKHFKTWLSQQPLPVEAAFVTAKCALRGAVFGGLLGTLMGVVAQAPTPMAIARPFAVAKGVDAGIQCVMKRLRGGKEDAQSRMVATFGSLASFALVIDLGGPNHATAAAVALGLFTALAQEKSFKLVEKWSQEEIDYAQTRNMLSALGLESYEKNFKKGLLTDNTLPLLTDRALREVKIPPGPRLVILDHIQRDPELK